MRIPNCTHGIYALSFTALILLAPSPAVALEQLGNENGGPVCDGLAASTDKDKFGYQIRDKCQRDSSEGKGSQPSKGEGSDGNQKTVTPPTYLKTVIVSGCVPDQPVNPDFGSCVEQGQKFCPEGEWLQARSIDTRTPQDDPAYGDPFCTGAPPTAAPPGTAGAPPVSIDEIRTLLVLRPEIESDNAGRGVRNAETNFYTLTEPVSMSTVLAGQQVELRAR